MRFKYRVSQRRKLTFFFFFNKKKKYCEVLGTKSHQILTTMITSRPWERFILLFDVLCCSLLKFQVFQKKNWMAILQLKKERFWGKLEMNMHIKLLMFCKMWILNFCSYLKSSYFLLSTLEIIYSHTISFHLKWHVERNLFEAGCSSWIVIFSKFFWD